MRGLGFMAVLLCVACASAKSPATVQTSGAESARPTIDVPPPDESPPGVASTDESSPDKSTPDGSTPDKSPPEASLSGSAAPATPAPPPERPAPQDKGAAASEARQCAARGGTMQPVCMSGHIACVAPYSDGGKRCSDKRDCIGACVYEGPEPPPANPVGSCQRTNDPCGCRATIRKGIVQSTICVD
jgi:hypothetical protein